MGWTPSRWAEGLDWTGNNPANSANLPSFDLGKDFSRNWPFCHPCRRWRPPPLPWGRRVTPRHRRPSRKPPASGRWTSPRHPAGYLVEVPRCCVEVDLVGVKGSGRILDGSEGSGFMLASKEHQKENGNLLGSPNLDIHRSILWPPKRSQFIQHIAQKGMYLWNVHKGLHPPFPHACLVQGQRGAPELDAN